MNERIQELARQAEIWANQFEEHWKPGPDTDELFKEKFAELIVRECAELCNAEAIFAGDNGRKDASASNCATIIKQHFGVE